MKQATSKTEHFAPVDLTPSQGRVLAQFRMYGDLTDRQLLKYLHSMEKGAGIKKLMSDSGARTRRKELVDRGLVRRVGKHGSGESIWGLRADGHP